MSFTLHDRCKIVSVIMIEISYRLSCAIWSRSNTVVNLLIGVSYPQKLTRSLLLGKTWSGGTSDPYRQILIYSVVSYFCDARDRVTRDMWHALPPARRDGKMIFRSKWFSLDLSGTWVCVEKIFNEEHQSKSTDYLWYLIIMHLHDHQKTYSSAIW